MNNDHPSLFITDNDREDQVARAGAVVVIESLLKYNYIKSEDIQEVQNILKAHKTKITHTDIIQSIMESRDL